MLSLRPVVSRKPQVNSFVTSECGGERRAALDPRIVRGARDRFPPCGSGSAISEAHFLYLRYLKRGALCDLSRQDPSNFPVTLRKPY
jgi:hypothetical protein